MQKFLRGSSWAAGLLLVLGCRSEQAAFSFRQPTLSASTVATESALPVAPPSSPTPSAPVLPPASHATVALAASAPAVAATARPNLWQPMRAVSRIQQQLAISRPHRVEAAARAAHPDTLHWVLGGALVLVGVVGGILFGGWLGLGVGAALVLLGYYFVVMGIGGRQAWLEVFQEFFNM